jgi:hypothetical protein
MICPYCNQEQPDGTKFCAGCGGQLPQSGQPSNPPPPQYQPYQPFYQPSQNNPVNSVAAANGKATAAMICGILSIVLGAIPAAIVAICLGAGAIKPLKEAQQPSGKALAGLILGCVGIVTSIAMLYWLISMW